MRQNWFFVVRGIIVLFFFFGGVTSSVRCGRMPPPSWPWWNREDSLAVRDVLEKWTDIFQPIHALSDTFRVDISFGLNYADSSSRTGDTLYKIAHFIRAWIEPGENRRNDLYQFGVTVDTVSLSDTFCQVIYRDTFNMSGLYLEFDTIWVVGFRPDTLIDTTKTPAETTIVQRVSYVGKRGFSVLQQAVKNYGWEFYRWIFLRRDTLPDTNYYTVVKISGGYTQIPTAEESPRISRVILNKPGRADTIFYAPRADGRGLTNLKPIDSLYQIRAGEEVSIVVNTATPQDTVADKNRIFLTVVGRTVDITTGAQSGSGVLRFSSSDTGYQHIFIEVLPVSNLLYPNSAFTGTIWAIPVRVVSE